MIPISLFQERHSEPSGKYHLLVFLEPMLIAFPGGGGLSGHSTHIILVNSFYFPIGMTGSNCSCLYGDLEVEWNLEQNLVWFARARSLDLTNGKCEF